MVVEGKSKECRPFLPCFEARSGTEPCLVVLLFCLRAVGTPTSRPMWADRGGRRLHLLFPAHLSWRYIYIRTYGGGRAKKLGSPPSSAEFDAESKSNSTRCTSATGTVTRRGHVRMYCALLAACVLLLACFCPSLLRLLLLLLLLPTRMPGLGQSGGLRSVEQRATPPAAAGRGGGGGDSAVKRGDACGREEGGKGGKHVSCVLSSYCRERLGFCGSSVASS